MALFKYTGTADELAQKVKTAGFVYATVDETETPGEYQDVGQWWIDIPSPDGATQVIDGETVPVVKRFRMAAASLIDEDGNVIDISNLFLKDEDPAGLRTILDVYSTDDVDTSIGEVNESITDLGDDLTELETVTMPAAIDDSTTKAFHNKTLTKTSWIQEGNYYVNELNLSNEDFTCGKDGTVPPEITIDDWMEDEDHPGSYILRPEEELQKIQEAWGKIQYAQANSSTKMIKFYASEALDTINIPLIIIDNR